MRDNFPNPLGKDGLFVCPSNFIHVGTHTDLPDGEKKPGTEDDAKLHISENLCSWRLCKLNGIALVVPPTQHRTTKPPEKGKWETIPHPGRDDKEFIQVQGKTRGVFKEIFWWFLKKQTTVFWLPWRWGTVRRQDSTLTGEDDRGEYHTHKLLLVLPGYPAVASDQCQTLGAKQSLGLNQ